MQLVIKKNQQLICRRNKKKSILVLKYKSLKKLSFEIRMFLDQSVCFDTLCREGILHKFYGYGMRKLARDALRTISTNQQMFICYKGLTPSMYEKLNSLSSREVGVVQLFKSSAVIFLIHSAETDYLITPTWCWGEITLELGRTRLFSDYNCSTSLMHQ